MVRKFLGFLVDQRGIEANLEKKLAILNMKSLVKIKEVQHMTSCHEALGQLLSKLGDKSHHFFATFKKRAKFERTSEAEQALQKSKTIFVSYLG